MPSYLHDEMAKGGYRVFAKLGLKVGKDILAIGFDNAPYASTLNPPLTTVEANAAELAYKAILHMADFLDENTAPVAQRVATHYIHRCSCGCANYDYDSLAAKLQLVGLLDEKKRPEILKHIMNYLFRVFMEEMSGWISCYYAPHIFPVMFILNITVYAVISFFMMAKIKKIPMDEALKTVE